MGNVRSSEEPPTSRTKTVFSQYQAQQTELAMDPAKNEQLTQSSSQRDLSEVGPGAFCLHCFGVILPLRAP